jgi:hypothetical protein
MGKLFLAIGALAGAALLAQYALSEGTRQVMAPGVERATASVEAVAAIGSVAAEPSQAPSEDPALAAFYGETPDDEAGEVEFDSTAE